MDLKHKIQTTYKVDYKDLEQFIQEFYGHPFDFAAAIESSNDTSHEFTVKPVREQDRDPWDKGVLESFTLRGIATWGTPQVLLEDLCARGRIEPGHYIIRVSW